MKIAIDAAASEGTKEAKRLVHVDTATLQGSIRPEPTKIVGDTVVGGFGVHKVKYAIYQEFLPPSHGGKTYMRPAEALANSRLSYLMKEWWDKIK